MENTNRLTNYLKQYEEAIFVDWMDEQVKSPAYRSDLTDENELKRESKSFLTLLIGALAHGNFADISGPDWAAVREMLSEISVNRAKRGFSPSETAAFVLSLKKPLFSRLRKETNSDPASLVEDLWTMTDLIDKLGLFTTETYQKGREAVIMRQQQDILEISTPVVKMWDGILALPMIGTLDSSRTQVVMETLLQEIVNTGAEVAIVDITGVPAVDTLVAQHLMKTVTAVRLMGAECIISGIRPQIAQTIVHLGVDLTGVVTKATMADAFRIALTRIGLKVGTVESNGLSRE